MPRTAEAPRFSIVEAVQNRVVWRLRARAERTRAGRVAYAVGRQILVLIPSEICSREEQLVTHRGVDHGGSLDQPLLPRLVVVDQLDGLARDGQPIRGELLTPDRGMPADAVAVILEVEIDLAVGVAKRVGVDASAELGLTDEWLGRGVDERPERVSCDGDSDALGVLLRVARGVIKQVAVVELEHFRRPGEAGLGPAAEPRQSVAFPALGVRREAPMDKVARGRDRNVGAVVGRISNELSLVQKHERIREILLENRHERRVRRSCDTQQRGRGQSQALYDCAQCHRRLLRRHSLARKRASATATRDLCSLRAHLRCLCPCVTCVRRQPDSGTSSSSSGDLRESRVRHRLPRSDGHSRAERALLRLCDSDSAQWTLDQHSDRPVA